MRLRESQRALRPLLWDRLRRAVRCSSGVAPPAPRSWTVLSAPCLQSARQLPFHTDWLVGWLRYQSTLSAGARLQSGPTPTL